MRKYVYIIIFSFVLFQCKTTQLDQIKKEINKSYTLKTKRGKQSFTIFRNLMFEKFPPDIADNDTIILMEYYVSVYSNYSFTLYESNNNARHYTLERSLKNGKWVIDSLAVSESYDNILDMVRMGNLDEVKRRGDAARWSPSTKLIINIGVKNEDENKFDFTTLVTNGFITNEYLPKED